MLERDLPNKKIWQITTLPSETAKFENVSECCFQNKNKNIVGTAQQVDSIPIVILPKLATPQVLIRKDNVNTSSISTYKKRIEFIAYNLGYKCNSPTYNCESKRIIDCAARGKYRIPICCWKLSHFESDYKCMKCYQSHNTSYYKPFCLPCYGIIKKDDGEIKEYWEDYLKDDRKRLLKELRWLYNLPNGGGKYTPCSICNRDYTDNNDKYSKYWDPCSNHVSTYVWWFGNNNRCCTVCLDKEIKRRNIVALR